jgi:cytochrome P450
MIDAGGFCDVLYALAREQPGRDVTLDLNGVPVRVLQNRNSIAHVLRGDGTRYLKNMAWFRQALGASRFSEDGEAWLVRHELTHTALNHFDRERTCQLARRHAKRAVSQLLASSGLGQLTIDDGVLRELAVSVLVESFFDIPFSDTGVDLCSIAEMMEYGSAYSFVPAGSTNALYREALQRLPTLRRDILAQLRGFRDGRIAANPLLASMLAADADPGNDVVLEHELLTFFAAGAETSAATLGWACYALARWPGVQTTLREAVGRVETSAGWPALAACTPLADFLSEVLRLFPPTPILARLATQSDESGGEPVVAGQNILISLIGAGHDTQLRENPWELTLDGARRSGDAGTHLAFGAGARVCGGKQFALVEVMTILDVFLRHAQFELTSNAAPRFHWKAQMLRAGGQPVMLHRLRT